MEYGNESVVISIDSAILTALIAGVVSLAISGISSWVAVSLQKNRLRMELKLEFAAETTIRELLSDERWGLRSFDAIKRRLGVPEDDELRKLLIRSGALRFEGDKGHELWGLRERNLDKLG